MALWLWRDRKGRCFQGTVSSPGRRVRLPCTQINSAPLSNQGGIAEEPPHQILRTHPPPALGVWMEASVSDPWKEGSAPGCPGAGAGHGRWDGRESCLGGSSCAALSPSGSETQIKPGVARFEITMAFSEFGYIFNKQVLLKTGQPRKLILY